MSPIINLIRNNRILAAAGFIFVLVAVVLSLGFLSVYENNPYISELGFIENSVDLSVVGSVVPASCESNPVANHAGDCVCNISNTTCGAYSAGGCDKTMTWTVNWPSGTANFTRGTTILAVGNNGNHTETIPPGGTYFSVLRPDGVALCSPYFVSGPLPPVVSLTASPNPVGSGGVSILNWTVTGATSCTASANDGSWNKAVPPNNSSDPVSPIVTTQYTLSCTGPGGITNSSVTVAVPSGFIDSTPCTIAASSTSCLSTILWDSYNFLGPTEVTQGTVPFSSAPTNTGVSTLVTPTTNVFTLTDMGAGSGVIGVETVSVGCVGNTVWVPSLGICAPQPSITIVADPNVIRSGTSATLDIEIDAYYDLTCTYRDGGALDTFTHNGAPSAQPHQYLRNTRNLTSAQIVSISCEAIIDPLITGSGEARVNVVPTIQEI